MLTCPFCGSSETDRFDLEGHRFVVFACMFSPEVDPRLTDSEIAEGLGRSFAGQGPAYFRKTCDTLHLYVTKGEGGRILTSVRPGGPDPPRTPT